MRLFKNKQQKEMEKLIKLRKKQEKQFKNMLNNNIGTNAADNLRKAQKLLKADTKK